MQDEVISKALKEMAKILDAQITPKPYFAIVVRNSDVYRWCTANGWVEVEDWGKCVVMRNGNG